MKATATKTPACNLQPCPDCGAEHATTPQYFTPKLHANMQALMQDGGTTRAKIAQQIALTFADCENIAEFTSPRMPSLRHAKAWAENLVEQAKTLRHLAAHLEEEEARASVADQIAYERSNPAAAILAHLRDEEEAEAMQDAHAAALQGENLLSPEENAVLALLANQPEAYDEQTREFIRVGDHCTLGTPRSIEAARIERHRQPASPRPSSVDEFGDDDQVGQAILVAAIGHLYNSDNYRPHRRTAGDCLAIDCMSSLRGMDWGDLREEKQNAQLFATSDDDPANATPLYYAPARTSSVDHIEKHLATYYTPAAAAARDDAGAEILKNASDYLYNRQPKPTNHETADIGDALAVEAMDSLRAKLQPEDLGADAPNVWQFQHDADCTCRECEPEPVDAEERYNRED